MTGSKCPAQVLEIPSARESGESVEIVGEALHRLRRSGYSALWDVSCDVHGKTVRLLGHLPSYYLKQVAQAIVAEVEGVRRVINLIEVAAPASRPSWGRERVSRAEASIGDGNKPQS